MTARSEHEMGVITLHSGHIVVREYGEERDAMRAELQRRVEEMDRGEVALIPGQEVFRELRKRLGGEEP
jgi:hypothetical protein